MLRRSDKSDRALFQSVSSAAIAMPMLAQPALSPDLMVEQIGEEEALALLAKAPSASWRQFPAYATIAATHAGAESRYLVVREGAVAVALANVRVKHLPLLPMGIAMIAQGPVMLEPGRSTRSQVLSALYLRLARKERLTLRINSPLKADEDDGVPFGFSVIESSNYESFLIDIGPEEEALRAALNGKWRTDLRRGERGDVQITNSSDPEDFRKFQPLLTDLAKSKGFTSPQDASFFAEVAEKAVAPEHFSIHLAWHKGRLVGGHIGAFSGITAVYLLGATNDEGRALRASFLLQWAVIRYARERGMRWYDLGGADEVDNPDVFRFKKRMGGHHYIGPPMIEAQAGWPSGAILQCAERIHSKLRG